MREQKRIRDEEKKRKHNAITGGNSVGTDGRQNISNAFIDQILNDEPLFPQANETTNQSQFIEKPKEELKVSSYVVDLQIPAPVSFFSYKFYNFYDL